MTNEEIEAGLKIMANYLENPAGQILIVLSDTLALMRESKPNDRSDIDRAWAVSITEMEKAIAYFKVYVADKAGKP